MARKPKFYVVWSGRSTGVFTTWAECSAQVKGFPGARFKSFPSRDEAEAAFRDAPADAPPEGEGDGPVLPSVSVDAACAGNPGPVEFRCVDNVTGEERVREGPVAGGTNNLGEFLGIVRALQRIDPDREGPVYYDSETAVGWVRAGRCNTTVPRGPRNAALFELIDEAESWLKGQPVRHRLYKWNTRAWGEIPADFGRK